MRDAAVQDDPDLAPKMVGMASDESDAAFSLEGYGRLQDLANDKQSRTRAMIRREVQDCFLFPAVYTNRQVRWMYPRKARLNEG